MYVLPPPAYYIQGETRFVKVAGVQMEQMKCLIIEVWEGASNADCGWNYGL
jgi:ribosome recycling factor